MSLESKIDKLNSNIETTNEKLDQLIELLKSVLSADIQEQDQIESVEAEQDSGDTDTADETKDIEESIAEEEGKGFDKAPEITQQDVLTLAKELINLDKKSEAREILSEYGVSKVPELKQEDYAAVYDRFRQLIEAEQ